MLLWRKEPGRYQEASSEGRLGGMKGGGGSENGRRAAFRVDVMFI